MAASRSEQPISVSQRPEAIICAGVCPNNDVTVWPDGRVLVVRHQLNARDQVEHFRVSHAEAIRFRGILLPHQAGSGRSELHVLQNAVNAEAIRQALWSVHLYVDGRRRD
jgi:hypothetical protein